MLIAVDAMGGDYAPEQIVRGAVQAVNAAQGFDVLLIGDEPKIRAALANEKYDAERIKIKHTTEVITNDDIPTSAIRSKKDSSLTVGFKLVKTREVDALISAGSSGALLAGSVLILKRIPGAERPAVGTILPTKSGQFLLLDSGFNATCKPEHYVQFARLGVAYLKANCGIENPTVGLINLGTEDEKGSETSKEANMLLKDAGLNYVGNIETRELFNGVADIAVTDGFTGNAVLKAIEGTMLFLNGSLKKMFSKNILTKLSYLLLKKEMGEFKAQIDPDVYGGAPILGVDGLVVKIHGNANAKTVKYAILQSKSTIEAQFIDNLKADLAAVVAETAEANKAEETSENA